MACYISDWDGILSLVPSKPLYFMKQVALLVRSTWEGAEGGLCPASSKRARPWAL